MLESKDDRYTLSKRTSQYDTSTMQQSSPSNQISTFKTIFFNMVRENKPTSQIQDLLITNRKILYQKSILHMYAAQPKLYQQFRYLLLGLSLTFDRKQQYNMRWGTLYEIMNEILKMPEQYRRSTKVDEHLLNFTLFLIGNDGYFYKQFPNAQKLLATQPYYNIIYKNQQNSTLLVKRIVRIFNSLLCLRSLNAGDYIMLVYYFGLKAQNYSQYISSIEQKFVKRLTEFQNQAKEKLEQKQFQRELKKQEKKQDSSEKRLELKQSRKQSKKQQQQNINNVVILDISQVYDLLVIFYDIDLEKKLRKVLEVEVNQFKQKRKKIKENDNQSKEREKNYLIQPALIQSKKANKKVNENNNKIINNNISTSNLNSNNNIHFQSDILLKFLLKQVIKNRNIKFVTKKIFITECFNQVKQIDEEFFDYLLQAEATELNPQVSDVILRTVQRQSLKFITVSRLKAIFKRINLAKGISYQENIKKMFKILRLICWIARKFNESNHAYILNLTSSIRITNLQKAMMVIFSIDFSQQQAGNAIQFQVNKSCYDVIIKYAEFQDSCAIEIVVQVDGNQKLRERKEVNKWSHILCMVGLAQKKTISIFIDGAYFKISMKESASQISAITFGPFEGSIKDVYILDKVYEMGQIHKGYFQKFRKMNVLLQQLGEKSFLFTFDRTKITEKKKWFWKKEMSVQYFNIEKLRSISFSQGVQQLGGFPALLFLVSKITTPEKSQQLVTFLMDFFELLKLLANQSQTKQTQKWMKDSTVYFGQFLWLVLSRNQYLRGYKQFFNRVFDFFGWFFRPKTQNNLPLKLAIIQDIYLNFQIWSKCSLQINQMLFNQLLLRMEDSTILIQMFNKKHYQKIMSSLVFFFLEENNQQFNDPLYISGIKISPNHDQISKIGTKILDLYNKQKLPINYDNVKKDLALVISLINAFFYKKHYYFSPVQLSALSVLMSHFLKNYMNPIIFQKTMDQQILNFHQLTKLISISPQHCELIFLLFQLAFILAVDIQNIKNCIALIIDGFTMNEKRAEDPLHFSFKSTIYIIKYSSIIYEQSTIFSLQQILSVLLGSLRNKANPVDNKIVVEKLNFDTVTKQFEKFHTHKLVALLSLNQFCMVIKECVKESQLFPTAVFFLKIVIKNQIFPEANRLANMCIGIIIEFISQHKGKLKALESMASHYINLSEQVSSISETEAKQKEIPIPQKALEQNMMKEDQELTENYDIIFKCQSVTDNGENLIKLQKLSMQVLKQMFIEKDIQKLCKYCKSQELISLMVQMQVLNPPYNRFIIPFKNQGNEKQLKNLGGNMLSVIRQQSLTNQQLKAFLFYYQFTQLSIFQQISISKNLGKNVGENEKDILQMVSLLIVFYHSLLNTNGQMGKIQRPQTIQIIQKIYQFIKINDIMSINAGIKALKKTILELIKRQESDPQGRIKDLNQLSKKLLQFSQAGKVSGEPFFNQFNEFKNKFDKGQFEKLLENVKYMKKFIQSIKQVIDNFMLLFSLFTRKGLINSNQKNEVMYSSPLKYKKLDIKRKKVWEIVDEQKKQVYNQNLKKILRLICTNLQIQSRKKEQVWKSLLQRNKFWVSSKIKDNQCYQIHPKITGFYRLNIIKTAFDQVPYPRRKSFDHQLQEENANTELQTKISEVELMKTLNLSDMNESNMIQVTPPRKSNFDESQTNEDYTKSKQSNPKGSFIVEYVTQRGVYAGNLFYSPQDHGFVFKSRGYASLPDHSIVYKCSTIFHRLEDKDYRIVIQTNNKTQIFARRYIHRHTAVQIFSHHKSYFFNFFFKDTRQKFFKAFMNKITCIIDLRAQFQKKKFTEKWMNGELDNFQYIMFINLYSGRTVNDLAQYPIMPWVIINYNEQETEVNRQFMKDPKNIRDLSKPSGKLNPSKFESLKDRCLEISDQQVESKFLYGTMYSNPTVIYNFFIRLEPFTSLHWEHQGRRIDHADRLFSAVKDQFNTVMTSTSDNKELVPQFYYWPQFLKNRNKVNLGIKQNKQEVHDVKLPGWAKNAEQFVFKMRQVLESADITRNIHQWIDLIFGYKNPKQVALQYDNLFHYRTYEHDIFETQQSEHQIKGAQITVSQFGQIPFPIFIKPHPQKTLVYSQSFKFDTFGILKKVNPKKIIKLEVVDQGFFLGYENQVQFYFQQIRKCLEIGLQKPTKVYNTDGVILKVIDFQNSLWMTLKDGILRIHDKKDCVYQLEEEVECFSIFGRYVIYGYRSELIISRIQVNLHLNKFNSFYGHKGNIYKIQVNIMLDIIVSVDESGLVLVHQFSKQKLLRQFELGTKTTISYLCIHEMGYFIFFTKDQKLIIFSFLGELFLNQDLGISNKAISQTITKIAIFEQNRSLLLVSTDKGKIYMVDFLQIKRFNLSCMYKQFSRFRTNILENCPKLGSVNAIKDFVVRRVPGKNVMTYKFYVLLENNSILMYYSSQQIQQKMKTSKVLHSLGLFDSNKKEKSERKSQLNNNA